MDNFLLMYADSLLRAKYEEYKHAFYVDLGYGAEPFTTLESAERLRTLNPRLPVLGVEIEQERVVNAKPFEDETTFFRLGGFNIPLKSGETVRLIRAFNVLRQYEESEVLPSLNLMGEYLSEGGLLIEGTSDPFGRIWVADLLRKASGELKVEG
ncbi:methylase, partial [bacterium]|nr:methylase [bacterium]